MKFSYQNFDTLNNFEKNLTKWYKVLEIFFRIN